MASGSGEVIDELISATVPNQRGKLWHGPSRVMLPKERRPPDLEDFGDDFTPNPEIAKVKIK
jgi:hypothetical protein